MERHRPSERPVRPARMRRSRRTAVVNNDHFHHEHTLPAYGAHEETGGARENHWQQPQKPSVSQEFLQDEYVQSWLAQVVQSEDRHIGMGLDTFAKKPRVLIFVSPESNALGGRSLQPGPDFRAFMLEKEHGTEKHKGRARHKQRKHTGESISTESFLEVGLLSDIDRNDPGVPDKVKEVESYDLQRLPYKRQRVDDLSVSIGSNQKFPTSAPSKEMFVRRTRHKTREDRYDANKTSKESGPRERKRKKMATTKPQKKASRKMGENVMERFSSKHVEKSRLTIQTSGTIGIFKNGRASSPVRRRGLPDLAFAEMDFLRNSKQQRVDMEESQVLSKSREKERRKTLRMQNEISSYFRPCATTHGDGDLNGNEKLRKRGPSPTDNTVSTLAQGPHVKKCHQPSSSNSTPVSTNLLKMHIRFLGSDPLPPASDDRMIPHSSPKPITKLDVTPTLKCTLSDKVTTYYTWSGSHKSSIRRRIIEEEKIRTSVTPELIRKELEKTGIFDHTGIERNPNVSVHGKHQHLRESAAYGKQSRKSTPPQNVSSPFRKNRMPSHAGESTRRPSKRTTNESSQNAKELKEQSKARNPTDCHADSNRGPQPLRPLIEHVDRVSGWEMNNSTKRWAEHSSRLMVGQTAPQSSARLQAAHKAYLFPEHLFKPKGSTICDTKKATSSVAKPILRTNTPRPEPNEQTDTNQIIADIPEYQALPSNAIIEGVDVNISMNGSEKTQPREAYEDDCGNLSPSNITPSNNLLDRPPHTTRSDNRNSILDAFTQTTASSPKSRSDSLQTSRTAERPKIVARHADPVADQLNATLPARGHVPGRSNFLSCQSLLVPQSLVVKPLYSHQIGNQLEYNHLDFDDEADFLGQTSLYDYEPLLEYSPDDRFITSEISDNAPVDEREFLEHEEEDDANSIAPNYFCIGREQHLPERQIYRASMGDQVGAIGEIQYELDSTVNAPPQWNSVICDNIYHELDQEHPTQRKQFSGQTQDVQDEESKIIGFWRPHRQY